MDHTLFVIIVVIIGLLSVSGLSLMAQQFCVHLAESLTGKLVCGFFWLLSVTLIVLICTAGLLT